ncbi:MAG: efflux RND transporter periplasmic adaptor subunit [Bryobacteraceae bacterium]|jgi:HlyD family secretion protein
MTRTRLLLLIVVLLTVALAVWIHGINTAPPLVAFAEVQRETLVSTLTTNGKAEPWEWVAVRAERPGIVARVAVQKGQHVRRGALLVELDAQDARAEVASAEAAVSQARAELETMDKGGRPSEQVEIANAVERGRLELEIAQRDYGALKRLASKQAATQHDVAEAGRRVRRLEAELEALGRKRGALVGSADRAAAEARHRQAQATLEQARLRLLRSRLDSPVAGIVYELPARAGAYLNLGDLAAGVGDLRRLRVRVYVDEPELGRVGVGMPVNVTWDALPGRQWRGAVERMPTQVTPVGTRQVGEVLCTIDNPDMRLLPGTNVNVEITSQVVTGGLTIPKEALRNASGQVGVYALDSGRVRWRPIQLGASSVTRAVVLSGLNAGDRVALPTEKLLHDGDEVRVAR